MKTVLVTGASGFIGQILCKRLSEHGFRIKAVYRPSFKNIPDYVIPVLIDSIDNDTQWKQNLEDVSIVIHAAARVQMMKDTSLNPLEEYRKINYYGTARLAEEALKNGVELFIHLSTAKVNGEGKNEPYTENDPETPQDPYGVSKLEAEKKLAEISNGTSMRVVNARFPIVYGPGVKANFYSLIKLVSRTLPLPLQGILNRRSFLYVENLCHALLTLINAEKPSSSVYFISDKEAVSSETLITKIAESLGCKPRLFPFPLPLLIFMGKITGKTKIIDRMAGSFILDASKFENEFKWEAPFSLDQGLKATTEWFRKQNGSKP